MKNKMNIAFKSGVAALAVACSSAPSAAEPVKIIFETDMQSDCDDAATLAMLHAYADRGEVELLAVMTNSRSVDSVAGVDAINTYFGRPDLPIGAYKGDDIGEAFTPIYRDINADPDRFPHDVDSRVDVPDAVQVYHEILEEHDDVVIVSVGHMQNIADLLTSEGGAKLVAEHVDQMVIVGGSVLPMEGETNLTRFNSAPAATFVMENFPQPMLFSPWEVGTTIITGAELVDNSKLNPAREAYVRFADYAANLQWPNGVFPVSGGVIVGPPLQDGRPSWDQVGAMVAARGTQDYFTINSDGYMFVENRESGQTEWRQGSDNPNHANHFYLEKVVDDHTIRDAVLDAMDYDAF